ncbi:MAG: hypothetical protein EA409_08650 [Saprospirales bacterium]|nr:MAG: hypothetical protein EA409_08650 [Saprospirales bacterium]
MLAYSAICKLRASLPTIEWMAGIVPGYDLRILTKISELINLHHFDRLLWSLEDGPGLVVIKLQPLTRLFI